MKSVAPQRASQSRIASDVRGSRSSATEHIQTNDGRGRSVRHQHGASRTAVLLALVPLAIIGVGGFLAFRLSGSGGGTGTDAAAVSSGITGDAAQDAEVLASMSIPEFRARDQDGREQSRAVFTRPRTYTVLNFVFTRCITVCPITTGQMIRVQEAIKEIPGHDRPVDPSTASMGKRFQLVSFSVDPVRDTPEAMKAHSEPFADPSLWTFLSSDAETVKSVVERGLGFALEEEQGSKIDLGGGESMMNIIHPSKLLLISPEGKVVGMYRGLDENDVSRLISRIKATSRER